MAARSISPQSQEDLLGMVAKRKREILEECAEAEEQPNKKRLTSLDNHSGLAIRNTKIPEIIDVYSGDDEMPDTGTELLLVESDDEEDSKMIDQEPEQGPIFWSEDQEEFPANAIYHEDVKQHQARISEFAVSLADHLSRIRDKGGDMTRLYAEAVSNQAFPEPKKPVITLLGDAGSGKSSLINSILDIPQVAKEGNYGRACTCVITEYTSPFPEQTKKFAAVVEFLDATQRCNILKDLLRDYIFFHCEKDTDWTFEEKMEYQILAQTAESTLLELFRGKPSFNDRTELESYIHTVHAGDTEDMLRAQLEVWCEELVADHVSSSQSSMIEEDGASQLNEALDPFVSSSNVTSQNPRLWPIVFKVKVGIRGSRVLKYIVLADCPGLSDINRVRVNASKNYIRSSDHLWIVAPVGRCVSDTTVNCILFEFGERFAGRLAIVCTKIDDRMRYSQFIQEYPSAAEEMENIEGAYKQAKTNFSEAKARARGVTRQSTIRERNAEVERCRQIYDKALNFRLQFMTQTRNETVEKQLYRDKSEYLEQGEKGRVYFVSNEHYSWLKGCKEAVNDTLEQLSAEMTGVPALRNHALSIPAQDMWLTFMAHIRHTSVAFVKSLTIWAARTRADSGDKLMSIKEKSMEHIDQAIKVYLKDTEKNAEESLVDKMRAALPKVARKGYKYLQDVVRDWRFNTIRACIVREGTFCSSSIGPADWNTKLRGPAVNHLKEVWDELFLEEITHSLAAESRIKDNLDVLQHDLKEMMEPYGIPMAQFEDFLNAQKHGITREAEECREKMDKDLRNIKQLTEKDNDVGYFAQAMKNIYQETAQIRGKGYKNTVMDMLEEFIDQRDDESPFIQMADKASRQVASDAHLTSQSLQQKCYDIYNGVFKQFGGLMIESEDDDADVISVKTALRNCLPQIDAEMSDIIKKLEAIQEDPRPKPKPKTAESEDDNVKKEEKQQDENVSETSKVKVEVKQEQQ